MEIITIEADTPKCQKCGKETERFSKFFKGYRICLECSKKGYMTYYKKKAELNK